AAIINQNNFQWAMSAQSASPDSIEFLEEPGQHLRLVENRDYNG
ncbi:MAG: hypothetical protein JWR69_4718, partial [Pedosphaera sp.]|nr:hypothetical protein [Pedosphaera sp.]